MDSELRDLREQLRRGQISRREFVARALAIGMTASSIGLLLHNAAPSLAAGARGPALSPGRGGTLRAADPGPTPGGLDPATQQDTATIGICHNIYNFLVRLTPHVPQIPYPDLATGWSTTPDGLTWTFPLHKGVRFHSGKTLTAADVIYSLNRIKVTGLGGAPLLANITKMEARDPYTVVMHVKAPTPDLPVFLADYHMCIVENNFDPTMKGGYAKFTTAPSGTGPFMLKDFVPGDHATIVRNPHYWEQPYPYLDAVKFVYLPQTTTQVAAVQSGQVDFVQVLTPANAMPLLNARQVKIVNLASTAFLNMRMRADRKPFSDPRVRNAFKYMVDRKAIDQALVNGLSPLGNDTPISPAFGRWYSNIGVRPRDIMKAQALLSAAGYTKDRPLHVNLYVGNTAGAPEFATAFQQMAGDVPNVAVTITEETLTTYYTHWLTVDFGITSWGARAAPQVILDLLYRRNAIWNEGHYYNKKLEALLTAASSEMNAQKRKSLYRQIETLISDDGPSIIPSYNVFTLPLRTRVQGFKPMPDTFHYYKTAWLAS
jgi:peptide/nickel transport system substrate-binding protein